MKILGIHDDHNATAALFVDNRIVACASEERFTQVKNQGGFPANSIRFVLERGRVSPSELDLIVLCSYHVNPAYYSTGGSRGVFSEKVKYVLKPPYEALARSSEKNRFICEA